MSEYAWMSLNKQESGHASGLKYAIFLPWKVPWNWIAFSQNSFVISPGLLYHLIRRDSGRLANEVFTSNPILSSKKVNGLKITNWYGKLWHFSMVVLNMRVLHSILNMPEYVLTEFWI